MTLILQDKHIYFPHELDPDDVCSRIQAVLEKSPNADVLADPRLGLNHYIWRECLEHGISPVVPLMALERERSLLGNKSTNPHDFTFACGYVGHDGPGTVNPRWNGLIVQLFLCIRQAGWVAGVGPAEMFGYLQSIWPTVGERWTTSHPMQAIQLYGAPNLETEKYVPKILAEHVCLTYTPHVEALAVNAKIVEQFIPEFA